MNETKRLLVADAVFLPGTHLKSWNFVGVFPQSRGDGAYRATYEEIRRRAILESTFYDQTLPRLVRTYESLWTPVPRGSSTEALSILLRPVMVTLVSLFIDRSIRLVHRLHQFPQGELRVVDVGPCENFDGLADLRNTPGHNWHFNQALIRRIAVTLGLASHHLLSQKDYPEAPQRRQHNFLSGPPPAEGVKQLIGKITNRLLVKLRQSRNLFARCASLGFSGDDYFLTRSGLYAPFGPLQLVNDFEWTPTDRDPAIRQRLAQSLKNVFPRMVAKLLASVAHGSISEDECNQLGESFPAYFADYCPIRFLEGLEQNLNNALYSRTGSRLGVLIGTDLVTDEAYFLASATKMLGGKVIGAQHGGHYGYIDCLSLFAQYEYVLYDKMLTWGWAAFDDGLPQTQALPVPSPRLSAHPIGQVNFKNVVGKEVLLLTNRTLRFSVLATCGQARVDFIDEILASQRCLIEQLTGAGRWIDHKPYSQADVDLHPAHYADLAKIGGEHYRLLESKQKGLSPALLKDYRVVLWDQIGTGTLDCFVSRIPTMIHWERIYSRESAQARPLIAELENVGVIHSSADSLAREMSHMLADPRAWMQDERRQAAIARFCNLFARTDRRWPALWRQALRALDDHKVDQAVFAKAGE